MRLEGKRVILTGATGGIGRELVAELLQRKASIVMVGRRAQALELLAGEMRQCGHDSDHGLFHVDADVTTEEGRERVVSFSQDALGGVDVLINLAGAMSFSQFSSESAETTEHLFQTNVLAPMQLTRLLLPQMVAQGSGEIVNAGSIFGSIAFAWFTTYSSTKFALRGFSEALRRELQGSGVGVSYIAPRAVRTSFNSNQVIEMCKATGTALDDPAWVASAIIESIEGERRERYLGFPEKMFVRINSLFPRLVDRALEGHNRIAKKFLSLQESPDVG